MKGPWRLTLLLSLIFGAGISSVALADPVPPAIDDESEPTKDTEEALLWDAQQLAKDMGLSVDEVLYRLHIQALAGDLEEQLASKQPDVFGGLWIEHTPSFKVVVGLTEDDGKTLASLVDGTELQLVTSVVKVNHSLADLTAWAEKLLGAEGDSDPRFDLTIDRPKNEIDIFVESNADASELRSDAEELLPSRSLPSVNVEVGELSQPNINIYGGLNLTTCTTGFSTRTTTGGQRGIATAGHCQQTQSFAGYNLPFQDQDTQGNQDVQWHSLPGAVTAVPKVKDSGGTRFVRSTRGRANQPVGALVCSYGMTTGYRCGRIVWKDYAPSYLTDASPTFIVLHNDNGNDIANPGDSGGPWYDGTEAWGIHSGDYSGLDAIYMAVNYISSLNIAVLLQP